MDRKNKVWLIVLALLLVAAIIAVVIFNGKLSTSNRSLESVSAQLADAQEANEALNAQLADAQEANEALNAQVEEGKANSASLETQLQEAEAEATSLETQLTEAQTKVGELEVQLNEATEKAEALSAQIEQSASDNAASDNVAAQDENASVDEVEPQAEAPAKADVAKYEAELSELVAAVNEAEATIVGAGSDAIGVLVGDEERDPIAAEAFFDGETLDAQAVYAAIEAIVSADAAEMSDTQKLAALEEIKLTLLNVAEELGIAKDAVEVNAAALAESRSDIANLQNQLTAAKEKVAELTVAIESGNATITALEAQVADLSETNSNISAEAETNASDLLAQIALESARVSELTAELEAVNRELAELEAYMLSRELAEGQAHSASTLDNAVVIAADGVTGTWNYSNTLISGNAVIVALSVDGEEVLTTEALEPGATLISFTLTEALSAGRHDGMVTATVYDADSEYVSATRIPVEVIVG